MVTIHFYNMDGVKLGLTAWKCKWICGGKVAAGGSGENVMLFPGGSALMSP
jgi:hypothetical protein